MAVAVPMAIPVEDAIFDISEYWEEFMDNSLSYDQIDTYYELLDSSNELSKRDVQTIAGLLELLNRSEIIWDVLDQVAGHPDRIQTLANLTSGLIDFIGASNISLADLTSAASSLSGSVNVTAIVGAVLDSGVVTNLLDGILLDDSFRPVLVNLINDVVLSFKTEIWFLLKGVFAKREYLEPMSQEEIIEVFRRASNEGSLETFASNVVGTILESQLVKNISLDLLAALNETSFLTYTVKRFLATPAYINMTTDLISDIYNTAHINIDLSSINISAIVGSALANPKLISNAVGLLLSGNLDLSFLGKYASAVSKIITGLEDKGLFQELNDFIFPSTSKSATATTSEKNKDQVVTGSTSATTTQSKSSSTATNGAPSVAGSRLSNPMIKMIFFLQSLAFGGVLLIL